MKLSFLPGDLNLNKEQDGTYLVTMQGQELLRTRTEKKALAKFNALRRELESQFPARELTPEERRAALEKYLMDYKANFLQTPGQFDQRNSFGSRRTCPKCRSQAEGLQG